LQEVKGLLGKNVVKGKGESVMKVVRKRGIKVEELKLAFAGLGAWEPVSMKGLENTPKTVAILGA
jgi:hypothetical protein